jgi:hypothetical protein
VIDASRVLAGPWCEQIWPSRLRAIRSSRRYAATATRGWGANLKDAQGSDTGEGGYCLFANRENLHPRHRVKGGPEIVRKAPERTSDRELQGGTARQYGLDYKSRRRSIRG